MMRNRAKSAIRTRAESRSSRESTAARPWTDAFLALVAARVSVIDAARRLGLSRDTIYKARLADARFAARWDAAVCAAQPSVSQADLVDQRLNGVAEPVFYRGRQVGERRRHRPRVIDLLKRLNSAERSAAKMPPPDARFAAIGINFVERELPGSDAPNPPCPQPRAQGKAVA